MTLVLDYAWARPDPKSIKAAGYDDVMRYLSFDALKNISAPERDALHAAGLGIGLVWETTATRSSQGINMGKADAQSSQSQADAVGFPRTYPIGFAVDFDATLGAVIGYFTGIKSVLANPTAVYGSKDIVDGIMQAGLATYGWQTEAWSGSLVSSHAGLYQRVGATVAHPIPSTDENIMINRGYPMWMPDTPAPVVPVPPKPVTGHPAPGPHFAFPLPTGFYFGPSTGGRASVSGLYRRMFDGHYDYWWIQQFAIQLKARGWNIAAFLKSGNNGVWGPEYQSLIMAFQRDQHLARVTGFVDSLTWHAAFFNDIS